ncbi:helix-turn-helix domain-containing protein [Paenibacillus sp. LMG 31459]|uniref:Helix-turn-helix domain-containing protein n=1 Tax=Paenibacillus phytohabitans TaxID=2654978 RepID=A0ABX1YM00_9BACL|nr:AraC family transcriptional regulator [Paenibacillus phytohabitans]NOU80795.1 helix-turn-helix domain-containing protein [Paenibacillus phytohabitans]
MRIRISSYLLKLIILTLVIGAFPVLILGWYSYHYSSQSVLQQVEERNSQVLRQSQLRVEQTLKMIDFSTTQLLGLPTVTNAIATKLGIQDMEMIHELYKNLSSIQTFELGIKDVYLFSLEQDWLITNSGMDAYSQPGLKEKLRPFAGMPNGSVWISGNSASIQGADGMVELNHAVINIKKWPINSSRPRGMIAVVLSSQQLNDLIANEPGMGSVFILDEDGRAISHSNPSLLDKDLSAEAYIAAIRDKEDTAGVFNGIADGSKASISYRKSAYNGWTYVSVVPTQAVTRQATAIGRTSILISLCVLAATVLTALVGSRRMYSPVRHIYSSLLPDKEQRPRKDEFIAISDRIQGILSDQTKLQFELAGQQQQLAEFLVRKMMLGEARSQGIQERLMDYGYGHTSQWTVMRVLLVQIDRLDSCRFTEQDRDLLLFAISNIALEVVPEGDRLPPIVIRESVVILTGTSTQSEEAFKESVYARAAEVQASVKRYLELQTSIGISRSCTAWPEVGRGYEEGENALKYRARLGEEVILFIEDVQPASRKEIVYPKKIADELCEAIKSHDSGRAEELLSLVMNALASEESDHQEYQMSLVRLLMDLIRLLQDAGISHHLLRAGEDSLFEELLAMHSPGDIEAWFGKVIVSPAIGLLKERQETQFNSISEEVKQLIAEAFDTDLTLEKCSARLNYHPQYISRVFRQETGTSFTDYLAQYRLTVAKRWLKDTDLTITEIAMKLKYNNPANFIRYFRKMEGITPGQYRTNLVE